jgi:predicted amidohydrolase
VIKDALNIGLLQSDIVWENKRSNLEFIYKQFDDVKKDDLDIIILPEMFNSGFSMNTQLSETMDGESIMLLKSIAKEKNCAITGSLIIEENGKYYNRLVFVQPNEEVNFYDKRHLFSLVGEDKHLASGKQKLTLTYKGWKLSFYICYDLRFPVWCNNEDQADLIILVANWPAKRIHHWDVLLRARAIENQCYVAATNRVGFDGDNNLHNGHSAIYDFKGDLLTDISESATLIIQKIKIESLKKHKERYPFLKDNDIYKINLD